MIEEKTIHGEIGQMVDLHTFDYEGNGDQQFLNSIKIGALTDQVPMGVQTASLGGLDIIVTQETLDNLIRSNKQLQSEMNPYLYLNSSDPLGTQKALMKLFHLICMFITYLKEGKNKSKWSLCCQYSHTDLSH